MKPKSKILIIAGSDSSGGAGIQADIKTVTALGGYAMTAITAITAQNTTGVSSVVPLHPKEIEKQILFTSQDIKPDAIKIGMLHSPEVILTVIRALRKIKTKKIILDPVMIAKGGFKLINDKAIKTLKKEKYPPISDIEQMQEIGENLFQIGFIGSAASEKFSGEDVMSELKIQVDKKCEEQWKI